MRELFEKIFRESTSSNELFDAFHEAIGKGLKDAELYKIFLSNFALSIDELKMYSEKLCSEFADLSYDIYMWTARVLEDTWQCLDSAYIYYLKSIQCNKSECDPYVSIARLYDSEIDNPPITEVLFLLEEGIKDVRLKSRLCHAIADLYGKAGKHEMKNKYLLMAARYMRKNM